MAMRQKETIIVSIHAKNVHDNGNGTFTIELESESLTPDERITLERLFPNLTESACKLLNQETLLASLATPAETMKGQEAPPPYVPFTDPDIDPGTGKKYKGSK